MASVDLKRIGGALAAFWAGGDGPNRSQILGALAIAGYEGPDEGNKQDLVRDAVNQSDDDTAVLVIEELLNLLRDSGYFRDGVQPDRIASLEAAVTRTGNSIDEQGFLTWSAGVVASAVPQSVAPAPGALAPPAAPAPGLGGATPASTGGAVPAPREEASPSLNLLLWSLRRLGAGATRPLVERRRRRTGVQVGDEYDLQDLVEFMLRCLYRDVRSEEPTPSSAGSSSRMDLHLREATTAVEIKVARTGHGEGPLKRELLVDINDYRDHPTVRTLIIAIYDVDGVMPNPAGFEHDLSRREGNLDVHVVVAPWSGPRTDSRPPS